MTRSKSIILIFFLILSVSVNTVLNAQTKNFEIIDFGQFEKLTHESSEKIKAYNFWATWCAPCIKEMPYFEKVNLEDPDVDVIFISMDDSRKPERVDGFIEKRNIKAPVYLLNDVDFNSWINKVDNSWSGAIPATLFILPDGRRHFHEGEVNEEELKSIIAKLK